MMQPTVVLLVVGLNSALLQHAPRLRAWAQRGRVRRLQPVLPAVTCSVQASMLTGLPVSAHGIVGNGWYHEELAEVQFWKQSNHLVQGPKVWELGWQRSAAFTCANLFWWFNMYSSVDVAVTPRPIYKADGRKIPDIYTAPPEWRAHLQQRLGRFPLFQFWGPGASIRSTRWIAEAAREVFDAQHPTLTLVYLPHLDYALQKVGPLDVSIPREVAAVDAVAGALMDHVEAQGARVIVLSEYGIEPVQQAVAINRVLRAAGWLQVREEEGLELLDAGASRAFAVADHQVAHVYLPRAPGAPSRPGNAPPVQQVADLCRGVPGVGQVLDRQAQQVWGIGHPRAGDLVLIASPGCWFSYHYWLEDARAPDFARTVEIHRKPGYDPLELFLDPRLHLPRMQVAWKLLRRKLGFRTLLDVIPLDNQLVRGSHGRIDLPPELQPVLITRHDDSSPDVLPCTQVRDLILQHIFGS